MRNIRPSFVASVFLAAGLLAAGAVVLTSRSPAAESPTANGLTAAEFEEIHGRLTRMAGERVWSIPWRLSVREAREAAAKENKPIFLWISNNGGTHPLGPC